MAICSEHLLCYELLHTVYEATNEVLIKGVPFPKVKQHAYTQEIVAKQIRILYLITQLFQKKLPFNEIKCQVSNYLQEIKHSFEIFNQQTLAFHQTTKKVMTSFEKIDQQLLKQCKLNSSLPSVKEAKDPLLTVNDSVLKKPMTERVEKFTKQKGGTLGLLSYKIFATTLNTPTNSSDENPIRTRLFSAAAEIGIAQVISFCNPSALPVYIVLATSHLSKQIGSAYEKSYEKSIEQNTALKEEMAYFWNKQWQLTGGEGPCFQSALGQTELLANFMQLPSDLLQGIHHQICDLTAAISNKIGLTEKNIAKAAIYALEASLKNNFDYREEAIFKIAYGKNNE